MQRRDAVNNVAFFVMGASCLVCYNFIILTYENYKTDFDTDGLRNKATNYLLIINFAVSMFGMLFFNKVKHRRLKNPNLIPISCVLLIVASIVAFTLEFVLETGGSVGRIFAILCVLAGINSVLTSVLQATTYMFASRYPRMCVRMVTQGNGVVSIIKYTIALIAFHAKASDAVKRYVTYGGVIVFLFLALLFYFLMEKRPELVAVKVTTEECTPSIHESIAGSTTTNRGSLGTPRENDQESRYSYGSGRLEDVEAAESIALDEFNLDNKETLGAIENFKAREDRRARDEDMASINGPFVTSVDEPTEDPSTKGNVVVKGGEKAWEPLRFGTLLMFLLYVVTALHHSVNGPTSGKVYIHSCLTIAVSTMIGKALTKYQAPSWVLYTLTSTRVICPLIPLILCRFDECIVEQLWYKAFIICLGVYSGLSSGFVSTSLFLTVKDRLPMLVALFGGTLTGTLVYATQALVFDDIKCLNSTSNDSSTPYFFEVITTTMAM